MSNDQKSELDYKTEYSVNDILESKRDELITHLIIEKYYSLEEFNRRHLEKRMAFNDLPNFLKSAVFPIYLVKNLNYNQSRVFLLASNYYDYFQSMEVVGQQSV